MAAIVSATYTILLVDDERHVLDALQRTLRGEGYRILLASDAHSALAQLDAERIDLILSDIDMPDIDGVELIKQVRREYPDVVRMLLTGDASLESAVHAINDGEVHRYLTKPWDSAELRATLRDACARLDELRTAAAASQRVTLRERLLGELAREHPGILTVELDNGVYSIDQDRLVMLVNDLRDDAVRSFFAADAREDSHGTEHR